MAHFAFITWDGGGNVSVALGIGDELVRRGQRVSVLAPRSLSRVIIGAGLHYAELGIPPPADPAARSAYLVEVVGSTSLAQRLPIAMNQLRPDVVVIDCNLAWALETRMPIPIAVLVHTAYGLYLPAWQPVIDAANERRRALGQRPFAPAASAWGAGQLLLIASLAQFDRVPTRLPPNAAYVGLVSRASRDSLESFGSVDAIGPPVVLVSYSTDPLQNSPKQVQAVLDALAELKVRVLATTSGTFEPRELSIPPNATVVADFSLAQVMPLAAVAVAHAGHGTTLSALCHGVPLVCVPGLGRDQVPIASRVAELGLGIAVDKGDDPQQIRDAVSAVLLDSSFRRRAQDFKNQCGDADGASKAADLLERMVN
jgi:UDP:flavonoid glycosyltransferase YjiC (YdhE family)